MTLIDTSQANMSRFNTGLVHVPSSASTAICDNTAQTKNYNTVTTTETTGRAGVGVCADVNSTCLRVLSLTQQACYNT